MYCQMLINTRKKSRKKGIESHTRVEMPHLIKRSGVVSLKSKWNKGTRYIWWKREQQVQRQWYSKEASMTRCLDSPSRDLSSNRTASKSSRMSKGSLCHIQCLGLRVTVKVQRSSCCPCWNRTYITLIHNLNVS